jgi:hypothetical protein
MDKYKFPGYRPVCFMAKVQPDQSLKSLRYNLVNTAGANLNGLSFMRITSRSETPFADLRGRGSNPLTCGNLIPPNPLISRTLETTEKDSGKSRNHRTDAAIGYSIANILFV